jgi:hypothetical protein
MSDTQIVLSAASEAEVTVAVPGIQGPVGPGVPSGGTTNQVLFKTSNANYDTAWSNVTSAMIGDLEIANADVATNAAIAGTKISPNFGSQNVVTTGTNTAASLIPTGSSVPANGIYLPSANNVAISTNGTGRLFVDSSGRVGVGTSSPSTIFKATVNGDGSSVVGGFSLRNNSTEYLTIGSAAANDAANIDVWGVANGYMRFATNNTERLRITADGKLGLGTSSPGVALTTRVAANGTPATTGTTQTNGAFRIESSLTSGCIDFGPNGASPWIQATDRSDLSQKYSLLLNPNGGSVGIGTTSPGYLLDLGSTSGAVDDASVALRIHRSGTSTWGKIDEVGGVLNIDQYDSVSPIIRFRTSTDGSTFTERVRIDSSGRLLVGTSTSLGSNAKVQALTGDLYCFEAYQIGTNTYPAQINFTKERGSAGSFAVVQNGDAIGSLSFRGTDGSAIKTAAEITCFVDGTPSANDMPGRLVFSTTGDGASSPTERMRIDSAGRLGLGTSSPVDRLHVDGRIAVTSDSSAPTTGEAFFYKSATGAVMSGFGASIETGGAGSRQTRLSIDSSGNVGIGTTSPSTLLHLDTLNEATAITVAAISSTGGQLRLGIGAKSSGFQSIVATGNGLDIGTTLGAPITFFTNGTVNERARIDSSGRLLVGTSTSIGTAYSGGGLIQTASNIYAVNQLFTFSSAAADGYNSYIELCRARGTQGSPSAVVQNDQLAEINFSGLCSSLYRRAAAIQVYVDGSNISDTSLPGRLVFSTTADGANSPTERLRIKNDGTINFSNVAVYADNAAAKTGGLVDGDVYRTSTGDLKIVYT